MNSLDYKVIGKKIRDRRKALDITQEQVAEYLDVNANVKQNFTSLGKHFFTLYGKEFFTLLGKEIFTWYGKQYFTSPYSLFSQVRYLVN